MYIKLIKKNLEVNKKNLLKWGVAGICLTLISIYVYVSPNHQGPILPCMVYEVTGLYCPGCGMSRAFNAGAHLQIYQSMRFNLLPYVLGPLMLLYFFLLYTNHKKSAHVLIIFMIVFSILYGIFRNIPYFYFLAPTII